MISIEVSTNSSFHVYERKSTVLEAATSMQALKTLGHALALSALAVGAGTGSVEALGHSTLKGQISLKGQPVSGSSITLW
ncbi:MAG: hypothetical protein VX628_11450, partial [Cyanobacteriota bacterium]|nr:hypothetical protein [Cyanobacteriota bacterium]